MLTHTHTNVMCIFIANCYIVLLSTAVQHGNFLMTEIRQLMLVSFLRHCSTLQSLFTGITVAMVREASYALFFTNTDSV